MKIVDTPCFDKAIEVCVNSTNCDGSLGQCRHSSSWARKTCKCGTDATKTWETPNWCSKQVLPFLKKRTIEEKSLSDYKERLVRRIKYMCVNLPELEFKLIEIIYRA